MSILRRIASLLLLTLAVTATTATAQVTRVYHPMDALTADEIASARKLLVAAGKADDTTGFSDVTLLEPKKAAVLAWKPGDAIPRKARVTMRRNRVTQIAIVDLTAGKVVSVRPVKGVQPSILNAEWEAARDLTFADPRWRKAMKKRGFSNFDKVICTPSPAGHFPAEPYAGRRILKVPCYANVNRLNPVLARPIEGLITVVDVDEKKVIDVIDTGAVVKLDKPPPGYGDKPIAPRPAMLPVVIATPLGTNIKVTGAFQVAWDNWTFHLRPDRRSGLIVSLVRFNDHGRARLIAYQMAVAEVFVPYMDPDPTWAFKTYLDVGEFGLGYLMSSLDVGRDCPLSALYADLTFANDFAATFTRKRAMCLFERPTGDPAWRHYDSTSADTDARAEIELVVRTIATVGNYDYIVDYVFTPRGAIKVRVGATGFDAIKSATAAAATSPHAHAETRHGALAAPHTITPYHSHYFSLRLDLDVDGAKNRFVRDRFMVESHDQGGLKRSLWRLESQVVKAETALDQPAGQPAEVWRVENASTRTRLGHHPAYEIAASGQTRSILAADDPAQARAAFSASTLWLTVRKADELWAAGEFANQSRPGAGLPAYINPPEGIVDTDLVVWYTLGFRHVTRPEDFPIMPTRWLGFELRPLGFFERDPSADLNRDFAIPPAPPAAPTK